MSTAPPEPSVPSEPSGPPESSTLPPSARDALQQALATEHAAVWAYSLAAAFVDKQGVALQRQGVTAHRGQRDHARRLLRAADATPVSAEPSYQAPVRLQDATSAARLIIAVEGDCATAWRAVLEHTQPEHHTLREPAVDILLSGAVLTSRWHELSGIGEPTAAFPGTASDR